MCVIAAVQECITKNWLCVLVLIKTCQQFRINTWNRTQTPLTRWVKLMVTYHFMIVVDMICVCVQSENLKHTCKHPLGPYRSWSVSIWTLKWEAACSKTLISTYQIMWCHGSEVHIWNYFSIPLRVIKYEILCLLGCRLYRLVYSSLYSVTSQDSLVYGVVTSKTDVRQHGYTSGLT